MKLVDRLLSKDHLTAAIAAAEGATRINELEMVLQECHQALGGAHIPGLPSKIRELLTPVSDKDE